MKESTNIFRVLIKTLLNAGLITDRTRAFYGMYVDMDELKAEGDRMVGDDIAEEGIKYLQEINFPRDRPPPLGNAAAPPTPYHPLRGRPAPSPAGGPPPRGPRRPRPPWDAQREAPWKPSLEPRPAPGPPGRGPPGRRRFVCRPGLRPPLGGGGPPGGRGDGVGPGPPAGGGGGRGGRPNNPADRKWGEFSP